MAGKTGTIDLIMAGDAGRLSRPERRCTVENVFIPQGHVQEHIDWHTSQGDTVTTTIAPGDQ